MYRDNQVILEAKNISKHFQTTDDRTLIANDNINLKLYKGKTLGLVGESGCGKSTLMRLLVSLDKPTNGEIIFKGKDITKLKGEEKRLNRQHIQMVFQDPTSSFNPKMKVVDIISEPLLNFNRIKKSEKLESVHKLLRMVELPESYAERYPHNMSGGERQRVAIARALALKPEVIIMDEATSALDVSVQKNIILLITKLQQENDITIGFICHDIALVQSIAHHVAVMYLGVIVEEIPGNKIISNAKHPYTKALISAVFDVNMDFTTPIKPLEADAPSPVDVPVGCPFQNRCEYCMPICQKERPILMTVEHEHKVACHLFKNGACSNRSQTDN